MQLLFKRSHHLGQEGVDYVEFLAATLHLGRLERDERLWRAFRHFDVDNTGFISRANLVSALPHLGKKASAYDASMYPPFMCSAPAQAPHQVQMEH
eukprot:551360-Pelagomonas_calceolata.AAC.2